MSRVIKIGTRDSQLALWQAHLVQRELETYGYATKVIHIKSEGDIDLSTPLYEIGVQGIFTKALDIALISGTIDIAVHSMKDVPTALANGTIQAAVLKRGDHRDVLIPRDDNDFLDDTNAIATIATSSTRRKAQWLNKYPNHNITNLRGNVNTRLRKLGESDWQGAIFASAGLQRVDLLPKNTITLNWMLPAPAQGAVVTVCRTDDNYTLSACQHFNDEDTAICTKAERDFLRALQGGCSTPIAAYAQIVDDTIHFTGNILSVDGKLKEEVLMNLPLAEADKIGKLAASKIRERGNTVYILNGLKNDR